MLKILVFVGLILVLGNGLFAQSAYGVWQGTERELRYRPEGESFVIENGKLRYNKALYASGSSFRVETSDVPVLGLYMPYRGGHLQWGIETSRGSLWLADASWVRAESRAGIRAYRVEDPLLAGGRLELEVLAMAEGRGVVVKLSGADLPAGSRLLTMYGGADSKRFYRNADLGVDELNAFDLDAEACRNNDYSLTKGGFILDYGQETRNPTRVEGRFSPPATLRLLSPYDLGSPAEFWASQVEEAKPVLGAQWQVSGDFTHFFALQNVEGASALADKDLDEVFAQALERSKLLGSALKVETPDPYFNTLGGALTAAADGLWEDVWLHGAIGWRMPLNGWRAAYTGDFIGWSERNRRHFSRYAASQVTALEPVLPHATPDSALNLARPLKQWGTQMYSNGYIARNPENPNQMHHYNMNLVYIDALLWHLNWTGDLSYAREVWPVLKAHLEWEKRNYDPDNDGLYDACAAIWASDALYYNSGAVTYTSAYNYRANRLVALVAQKIGEDPGPYQKEAERILEALNQRLWLEGEGHWAEFQDYMGLGLVHDKPGLWTIYHAIDSEVHTPFQAYQATRYIDTQIPHIPIRAKGLPDEGYYTLSTTNWFPYSWSVNNVAFAEVAHTALAYWQSGRSDVAAKLFKSILLDGMYLGSSPGNIGQISFYDAARGECYRDFGDPVGMYSRALVEGLYGIQPDLLNRRLVIRPGFPAAWEHASFSASYLDFSYRQEGLRSLYTFHCRMDAADTLELKLRALGPGVRSVRVNGRSHSWQMEEGVGQAYLVLELPMEEELELVVAWDKLWGNQLDVKELAMVSGEELQVDLAAEIKAVKDPQGALSHVRFEDGVLTGRTQGPVGAKTLFVQLREGSALWWQPLHLELMRPFALETEAEAEQLSFRIKNQGRSAVDMEVVVNPGPYAWSTRLELAPESWSQSLQVPKEKVFLGSNRIELRVGDEALFQEDLPLWNLEAPQREQRLVSIKDGVNASLSSIFDEQYLSPRSPFTTLQIPVQGIGEWCHPKLSAEIDDSGLRSAVKEGVFETPMGLAFSVAGDSVAPNVLFVSQWDNYPERAQIPLEGHAQHVYLLMAGSTNHMQSHLVNGRIRVKYKDGGEEVLELINPNNWLPIEQDLFLDEHAFYSPFPRPYRVALKTGEVSRNMEALMAIDPDEVYGRSIDGGAGLILDLPLDASRELEALELEAVANEVLIGLLGLTLVQ